MIVYGWRGSHIKSGQIQNVKCPKCEEQGSMIYSVFGQYAHIYWIPLFPYQKKAFTECNSCKATFDKKSFTEEMNVKLKRDYETKGKPRFPFWMFTGVGIIVSLIIYSNVDDYFTDKKEDQYIKNPKVGDVYHIRMSDGKYSCLRVEKVSRDNVELLGNNYETDMISDVDEINIPSNYSEKNKFEISPLRLYSLYQKDTIYTIQRN